MAVDVTTAIEIARPVSVVATYAADPDNAPTWYRNIESVTWVTPPPLAIGSKLTFVASFMGRRLEYTYEIVEHVPEARFVMHTEQGPFPMETTYEWSPAGEGATHMTLRNRGEPAGFSKVASVFMAPAMRRANRKDLVALRELLEGAAG